MKLKQGTTYGFKVGRKYEIGDVIPASTAAYIENEDDTWMIFYVHREIVVQNGVCFEIISMDEEEENVE